MAEIHPIVPEPADADQMTVDLDDLTLGELEEFEDITGQSFDQAQEGGFRSVKALIALVFLSRRKVDPAFTLDDARNTKVTSLRLNTGAEGDPTVAGG